jgi:putative membrane protein
MRFLLRLLITAAALWVAVKLVPGIHYFGPWHNLLAVALVFGLVNAIVRPILFLLTCPLVFLTLGLFIFVLNAAMLLLTSAISHRLGFEFVVTGFVPALIGAIVVGITSAILNMFVAEDRKEPHRVDRHDLNHRHP